jgi:hypothetical protein
MAGRFNGSEGGTPAAPLVQGMDGLLYGVAAHGGDFARSRLSDLSPRVRIPGE